MRGRGIRAFTLIELLVVITIIGLLIGITLPALGMARLAAKRTKCLANMRGLQVAHWVYMTERNGRFIDVGLSHGGVHLGEDAAWINTLREYYGGQLLARSPVDDSPHWGPAPAGLPIPGADPSQRRRTSYGVNSFLTEVGPPGFRYLRLDDVPNPSSTVQFVIMAYGGAFAGADHPHPEGWGLLGDAPVDASGQMETNAHGGKPGSWDALGNYGFLDGHAETAKFREVFETSSFNRFNPAVAK